MRPKPPSAAENVLHMATAAGIALRARNGRVEATTDTPLPEVLRRMIERNERALLALLIEVRP